MKRNPGRTPGRAATVETGVPESRAGGRGDPEAFPEARRGLVLSGWPLAFAGLAVFALGLIVGSAIQSIVGGAPAARPATTSSGQFGPTPSLPEGAGAASDTPSTAASADFDDPSIRLQIANTTDYQTLVDLGNHQEDQHHGKMAILAYEKALSIRPGDPNVVTDLGIAYRMAGQPQEAVKRFRQAAKLDPSHTMCWYNLGIVLRDDLGDTQGALEAWQHLLAMNPSADLADKVRQMVSETRLGPRSSKP